MQSKGPNQSTIYIPLVANTLGKNDMYVGYNSFLGTKNPPHLGTQSCKGHILGWDYGGPIFDTLLLGSCHLSIFNQLISWQFTFVSAIFKTS